MKNQQTEIVLQEKNEIIERALQEAVGGGLEVDIDLCQVSCSIFSINVCNIDLCSISF